MNLFDKSELGDRGSQSIHNRAERLAQDPEKLGRLVDKAKEKANKQSGPLEKVWDNLILLFRLIQAYIKGSYCEVPWQSMVMIIGAVLYFVLPIDLIPDFLLGVGYIDDAAVIAWTLKSVQSDIERFKEWEESHVIIPNTKSIIPKVS